jgi:hypothetical protein
VDPRTARALDDLLAPSTSFYQRADQLVRLLTRDNASTVMARLPRTFRDEFVTFAREAYEPRGARFVVAGPPLPEACLEALREWLARRAELGCEDR